MRGKRRRRNRKATKKPSETSRTGTSVETSWEPEEDWFCALPACPFCIELALDEKTEYVSTGLMREPRNFLRVGKSWSRCKRNNPYLTRGQSSGMVRQTLNGESHGEGGRDMKLSGRIELGIR